MFATQCSNPQATKAEMGSRMPRTLSAVVFEEKPIHTARHTRMLQRIALKKSTSGASDTLPAATGTNASPTAPPVHTCKFDMKMMNIARSDPARLPTHTMPQLRNRPPKVIFSTPSRTP